MKGHGMKIVYEGERIPFGYGYVRYDFSRDGRMIAPMPANWIIRWSTNLWLWALRKSIKPLTAMELTNHERVRYEVDRQLRTYGIERYNAGYEYGFKAGWDAFAKHMLAKIDADAEAARADEASRSELPSEPVIESCPECHGITEHVVGCSQMDVAR